MASPPEFPANKRYGMHFRHHTPTDEFFTNFPNQKIGNQNTNNVSILTHRTPDSIEEALALSQNLPPSPPPSSKSSTSLRQPLSRSQSSSLWTEIRKSPTPKQEPQSRKTGEATIRTDATESQPAFESDAFAIHMPTTREPIIDPLIARAKVPKPIKGQIEAYQKYKEKAQQVRERQKSEGVRVPSKIVSYDYAYANAAVNAQPLELDVSPPTSSLEGAPAGSFPVSPIVPQHGWARPAQQARGPRSMSDSSHFIARKPVGLVNAKPMDPKQRYYQRVAADADTGASRSTPSPKPPTIKIRLKPKVQDPIQKESWWGLYNRSPQPTSDRSRSPSPAKANFAFTSPGLNDVFGYATNDITGTTAGAAKSVPDRTVKPNVKSTSRWGWFKPVGPRVVKPTTTQNGTSATTNSIPKAASIPINATHNNPLISSNARTYVDPFLLHATPTPTHPNTPTASRPASPKKLQRGHPPSGAQKTTGAQAETAETEKGKFESGFAQVKSLTSLLVKACLLVYALVGLYFLLDAIREAVHAIGAPFRGIKFIFEHLWIVIVWAAQIVAKVWDQFGVKVALKG